MSQDVDRVIIARYPDAGFGDHLSCLFGAWHYAKRTNRKLIIDWRGSRYNSDKARNCFHDFFLPRDSLCGVPVISDDTVSEYDHRAPYYPSKWTAENLRQTAHVPHTAAEISAFNELIKTGTDRPEPTIIINQHVNPNPPKDALRMILKELHFTDRIAKAADNFIGRNMDGGPFIGAHIRHGNGENIGGRVVFWLDGLSLVTQLRRNKKTDHHAATPAAAKNQQNAFKDNMADSLTARPQTSRSEKTLYDGVAKIVNQLRLETGIELPLFLCTDAERVINGLKDRVSKVVTYPKTMIAEGGGPLHQTASEGTSASSGAVANTIIDDMLIETEILRRCSHIVCIPSQFSLITRTELDKEAIFVIEPPLVNKAIAKVFG